MTGLIFGQDNIAFQILDVLYFEQENVKLNNKGRNFEALSFRLEADTVIESESRRLELKKNSVCYFPSGVSYRRTSAREKFIVVHFKALNYPSDKIECFYPENPSKYEALFKEMLDCYNKKEVSYKYETASILNRIFAELYRDNKPERVSSPIERSLEYIENNFMKSDFSLCLAAEKSAVSETYFRRLFKKEFGVSPKKYVINRRMEYAATLIISGYYSLNEVALKCGYDDYKHFSVEFKKIKGISPSKYGYNFTVK